MKKNVFLSCISKDEVKKLLKLNANKRLIKQHVEVLTSKPVLMKDIHNIASAMEVSRNEAAVSSLTDMMDTEYPSYTYRLDIGIFS